MIYRFIYFPLIHRALYCFPENAPRRSTVTLISRKVYTTFISFFLKFVIYIMSLVVFKNNFSQNKKSNLGLYYMFPLMYLFWFVWFVIAVDSKIAKSVEKMISFQVSRLGARMLNTLITTFMQQYFKLIGVEKFNAAWAGPMSKGANFIVPMSSFHRYMPSQLFQTLSTFLNVIIVDHALQIGLMARQLTSGSSEPLSPFIFQVLLPLSYPVVFAAF